MKIPVVFVLLAAGLEAVLAVEKYFEIGGKLSLKPESVPTEGITNINWKHNGDFVAEWIKDNVDMSYGDFKGRTALNTTTGELIIRSTRKADEGTFTVEINNKAQTVGYSARGVTHLRDKKVEVLPRPASCSFMSYQCTLSCLGHDTDVGPVQYSWKQDEGPWKESQKDIIINNDEETRQIKTFSCKIKNPISEKNSEPLENPFKSEEKNNGGLIVGIIFLVLLVLGGAGLSVYAYKHPDKFERLLACLPEPCGKKQPEEPQPPVGNHVTDLQRTDANTGATNRTSPEPNESSEMTPLQASGTGTSNGAPDKS